MLTYFFHLYTKFYVKVDEPSLRMSHKKESKHMEALMF